MLVWHVLGAFAIIYRKAHDMPLKKCHIAGCPVKDSDALHEVKPEDEALCAAILRARNVAPDWRRKPDNKVGDGPTTLVKTYLCDQCFPRELNKARAGSAFARVRDGQLEFGVVEGVAMLDRASRQQDENVLCACSASLRARLQRLTRFVPQEGKTPRTFVEPERPRKLKFLGHATCILFLLGAALMTG